MEQCSEQSAEQPILPCIILRTSNLSTNWGTSCPVLTQTHLWLCPQTKALPRHMLRLLEETSFRGDKVGFAGSCCLRSPEEKWHWKDKLLIVSCSWACLWGSSAAKRDHTASERSGVLEWCIVSLQPWSFHVTLTSYIEGKNSQRLGGSAASRAEPHRQEMVALGSEEALLQGRNWLRAIPRLGAQRVLSRQSCLSLVLPLKLIFTCT